MQNIDIGIQDNALFCTMYNILLQYKKNHLHVLTKSVLETVNFFLFKTRSA